MPCCLQFSKERRMPFETFQIPYLQPKKERPKAAKEEGEGENKILLKATHGDIY